jgi:diguanylate cyclase (GGDEF)-like protein/PAS domain S-box-containing protein
VAKRLAFDHVLRQSPVGIAVLSFEGFYECVNAAYCEVYGHSEEELLGQSLTMVLPLEEQLAMLALHQEFLTAGGKLGGEAKVVRQDGSIRYVNFDSAAVIGDDGQKRRLVYVMDITVSRHLELELIDVNMAVTENAERWKFALEGSGDGVWDWNIQTGEAMFSNRYKEMLGYSDDEIGHDSSEWSKRVHPDDLPHVMEVIHAHLDGKTPSAVVEFRMLTKDGSYRWILGRGLVVSCDAEGKPLRLVGTNSDITLRKELEEKLEQLAFYDPLTHLPNRRLQLDRLEQTITINKRKGLCGALMYIDLDNFKPLNDAWGHAVGDLLLIEVAIRLKTCVREMDSVARFGGDEFVAVISELDTDVANANRQARSIAELIRLTLDEPYVLHVTKEDQVDTIVEHHCTASIGVAIFGANDVSQKEIIRRADAAMYQAKDAGRNTVRFNA